MAHHLINTTKNAPVIRYLISGGASFVVEVVVLHILVNVLSVPATAAVALSFWVGLVVSFLLQKLFTFSSKATSRKKTWAQIVSYGLLVLFNYVFTIVFVGLASEYPVVIVRTIAIVLTTGWNYYIYKKIIFA